jgi:hypothetical protein
MLQLDLTAIITMPASVLSLLLTVQRLRQRHRGLELPYMRHSTEKPGMRDPFMTDRHPNQTDRLFLTDDMFQGHSILFGLDFGSQTFKFF